MKKTKVLLLGGRGSLGRAILSKLKLEKNIIVKNLTRKEGDVATDINKVFNQISRFKPNYILNCIASNGINYCEENQKEAFDVNSIFPFKISNFIKKKIKLIHFSTEAVFEGNLYKKIYNENSLPCPTTVYGISKYFGELAVLKNTSSIVIRLPLLFGPTHTQQIVSKLVNQIKKNKKVYVSKDVYSTPVYSPSVADYVVRMIRKNIFLHPQRLKSRLIHLSSKQYLSLYDLIYVIAKKLKKEDLIIPAQDKKFNLGWNKPRFLGLNSIHFKTVLKINKKTIKDYLDHL